MVETVKAWHPDVPLVQEVLHATFDHHAYPAHTHDTWTVLIIDTGTVAYRLDGTERHAETATVTILPPHVPHDGRSAVEGTAFRKRVLYLDAAWLPDAAASAAAQRPTIRDSRAVATVTEIHGALSSPGDGMTAEGAVLSLRELVQDHLGTAQATTRDAPLARQLRQLLDERLAETFTIAEAARILGAHPSHLVRAFSRAYGIAPHRYVTGRRVDTARRLLLAGHSPAETAVAVGFHDQAHLNRHFRRVLGTTPGRFAA